MKLQILILLAAAAPLLVLGDTDVSLVDLIPFLSQLKSVIQTAAGEYHDANVTTWNFLNYGIGASQVRSLYNLIIGEPEKAFKIQKEFVSKLEPVLDGFPVLGHVKGVGHLIAGDKDHGWDAIKAATSSTATAAGAVFGGGVGALAGRALSDSAITAVESLVRKDLTPYGTLGYVQNFGHTKAGEHFDLITGLGLDAYGGSKVQAAKNKLLENSRRKSYVGISGAEESVADLDDGHGAPSVSGTNNDHGSLSAASSIADESHRAPSVSGTNNDHGSLSAASSTADESHRAPSVSGTNNDHGSPSAASSTADESHRAPSIPATNNDHGSPSAASSTADKSYSAPSVSAFYNVRGSPQISISLSKNSPKSDSLSTCLDDTSLPSSDHSLPNQPPGPLPYYLSRFKDPRLSGVFSFFPDDTSVSSLASKSSSGSEPHGASAYHGAHMKDPTPEKSQPSLSASSSSFDSQPRGMLAYYLDDPRNAHSHYKPTDGRSQQSLPIRHGQSNFGPGSKMNAEILNFQERENYIKNRQKFLDDTKAPSETAAFVQEYGELLNYRYDSSLAKLDMNKIKENMPYLDDNVKSLITSDELRTINRNDRTSHNSMTSSLAGVLKMDVEQLKESIETDSQLIYDNTLGEQPEYVLRTCKQTGYLDYTNSPTFNSIEELHNYLEESSERLANKDLILSQFKSDLEEFDGFKSLVLKYKLVNGAPVKLLVDYRVPGLACKEMANPNRFEMHLDNVNYYSYIVYDVNKVHQ